jgi:predicted  nucleic acid-binding Zn-ribbon protein
MIKHKEDYMKKVFVFALALIVLAGCNFFSPASSENPENESSAVQSQTSEASLPETDDADGDKDSRDVEITVPASLVSEDRSEELTDEDKANGIKEIKTNDDGSITITIDKSNYADLVKSYSEDVSSGLSSITNDFPSIKKVDFNDDYSKILLIVDRRSFEESIDSLSIFSAGFQGMIYQIFAGIQQDEVHVEISIQDESTGEIFQTLVYSDDLPE